jgi:hypothetical protein
MAFVIFSVPLVRYLNYGMIPAGYESYYHLSHVQAFMNWETLTYNPFHILLTLFSLIFSTKIVFAVMPILISLLIILQLLKLLEHLDFDPKEQFLICLFFILSPIFIMLGTTVNVHFFTLLLILIGLDLSLNNENLYANALFIIAAMSSMYAGLSTAAFLLFYFRKQNPRQILKLIALLLLVSFITRQIVPTVQFGQNILTDFIGDLGSLYGFSIYTLILFAIGFVLSWAFKYELAYYYGFIFFVSVLAVFFNLALNVYLLIPICIFATYGLTYLMERKWNSELIRDLTLLILIAGLVTSGINSIKQTANTAPDYGTYQSLVTLRLYASQKEIVLSSYDKSEWIRSIAEMPVFNDFNNKNEELTQSIFQSRNFEKVITFLKENKIRYIWLDNDLKNRYWQNREQGLLFFMRNKENFENVYTDDSAELWKFIGDIEQ